MHVVSKVRHGESMSVTVIQSGLSTGAIGKRSLSVLAPGGMGKRSLHVLLAAFVWLLSAATAIAQPRLELEVEQRQVYPNEPFVITLHVIDFEQASEPIVPNLADCQIEQLGEPSESTQMISVNTRTWTRRSRVYNYELTPRRVGELVIPPFAVDVDGRRLSTEPVRVRVARSESGELLEVAVECDSEHVYVGQQVRLTLEIWVRPAQTSRRMLEPREMIQYLDTRRSRFGPFPLPDRYRIERISGQDGTLETYYVYPASTDFVPTHPGAIALDDVLIAMNYPGSFGRDIFGDEVVTSYRRLRVRPKVSTVDVRPLPTENRPASFNGAVGRFTITTSARPTTVHVGDPIELTFEIRGEGALDALPPPVLNTQSLLTAAFRVPSERLAGQTVGGVRRFTQTIRPKRADVTAIPPIEYCYFDPELGEYVITHSEPIPISVSMTESVSAEDLIDADASGGPRSTAAEPLDGLRGIETDTGRLLARSPTIRRWHVGAVTATPAAVYALSWVYVGLVRLRGHDPARQRRRTAGTRARQRLRAAGGMPAAQRAREIEAAIAGYVADRFDQPPGSLTGRAAIELLAQRGAPAELAAQVRQIVERCEEAAYGGQTAADADELLAAAEAAIGRLERRFA